MSCSIRAYQRHGSIVVNQSAVAMQPRRVPHQPELQRGFLANRAALHPLRNPLAVPKQRRSTLRVQSVGVGEVITTGIMVGVGVGVGGLTGLLAGYAGGSLLNCGVHVLEKHAIVADSPARNVAWDALGFSLGSNSGMGIGALVALSMCTGFPFAGLKYEVPNTEVTAHVEVSHQGDVRLTPEVLEALHIKPGDSLVIETKKKTAILKPVPALTDAQPTTDVTK